MKDSLFDILLNLFEKTLSHLKHDKALKGQNQFNALTDTNECHIKAPEAGSFRVFTEPELLRLTKASYQFLVRIMEAKIIQASIMEQIINKIIESDSRYVTLQETKWILRNKLAAHLSSKDLAFLDLILYQKEDGLPVH